MSYNFPLLNVTRKASGAIAAYRIVALVATFGSVAQATLKTQKYEGVNGAKAAVDTGDAGINTEGIVPVEYGGEVAIGDQLTSDGSGRAIRAIAGDNVIGFAEQAGSIGNIGSVHISRTHVLPAS